LGDAAVRGVGRIAVEDLVDGGDAVRGEPGVEEGLDELLGAGFVFVDAEVGVDESAEQPRPNRALM